MLRRRDDRDRLVEELRDRIQSLERRLDEAEASRKRADDIIEQLTQASPTQASPPPSVIRGALAEGANELAKQVVPFLIAGFVFVSTSLGTVISYLNNANILAVLTALFGVVGTLAGTYFGIKGIKSSSEARESAADSSGDTGRRRTSR